VNSSVKPHSAKVKTPPRRWCSAGTLSAMTTATLSRIATIRPWSNQRPARVSDSKMMV